MTYDEALNIINSSIAPIITPSKHKEADKAILDYASGLVSNTAFGPSWAGAHNWSPSASALYEKFASIAAFNEFQYLLLGEYGSLSETLGGRSSITGNSIIADTETNNTIKKTSADFGQFMRMRYNEGISFHTGIAGAIGDTYDDDYNKRILIDNSGRLLSFTDFCDNLGNVSISLSDRQAFDSVEALSVDYNNRKLFYSDGTITLDWLTGYLRDADELASVSWKERLLLVGVAYSVDWGNRVLWNSDGADKVDYSGSSSAVLSLDSTTKAFVPPRMTTAQKNSIASPILGSMVTDITIGKLCMYGVAGWETITSV